MPDGRMMNGIKVYSNLGERFESSALAAESVAGPNASGDLILAACRGDMTTAYGRTWSFNEDGPFADYVDPRKVSGEAKKKVICCSEGLSFLGADEAAAWLSERIGKTVKRECIYQAIRKSGRSHGVFWKYGDSW